MTDEDCSATLIPDENDIDLLPKPRLTTIIPPVSSATRKKRLHFESVVKIFVVSVEPNYSMPWQMKRQRRSTSSGFVIGGKRLITNAHAVSYQTSVQVRKHGDAKKYTAKIIAVGHPCDLAVLTVPEEEFWVGLTPLEFGDVPHLQEAVTVVGYPT
eukprot:TRINITY_DN8341_c0_g1_i1.p1 TRINITY_DN8341_c0_g1~~TRINITY_DN8341_c0_g1_i1.p1  ORF type:complete len:156 (-),score=28.98 TRINITY_DN8341_c0_g1_i1:96-563(-)